MVGQNDNVGGVGLSLDRGRFGSGFGCVLLDSVVGLDDTGGGLGSLVLGRVLSASAHSTVWTFHGYICCESEQASIATTFLSLSLVSMGLK